jgi:hypothetical protein
MARAKNDSDRRSWEWVNLPELILQVSLIAKVHNLGIIAEQHEGRRSCGDLGGVVNLQDLALGGHWS